MATGLSEFTIENMRDKTLYLEQSVGDKLGLKPDPVYITPQMMLEGDDLIRRTGIVQGLQDLGYLPEIASGEADSGFSWGEINSALLLWRFDTLDASMIYKVAFSDGQTTDKKGKPPESHPDFTDPLSVLIKQTSFDGEMELSQMPQPGESVTLISRILHFRLKTLNFYDGPINAPMTDECKITFFHLKALLGYGDDYSDVEFLNLLGNVSMLSDRFCTYYRDRVFVYQDDSVEKNNRIAGNYSIKWLSRYIRVMRPMGGKIQFKTIKKEGPAFQYNKGISSSRSLEEISRDEINILGLELLQLRLWQHGYYTGAIDADWGKISEAALDEFFGSCTAFEKNENAVRDIADGGYVLNLVYILNNLMPLAEHTISDITHEHLREITEQIFPDDAVDPAWKGLSEKAEEVMHSDSLSFGARPVHAVIKGRPQEKLIQIYRRRRLNFSWTGIKAAICGWFRRFLEELGDIRKAISEVAKKVRQFILKGIGSVMTVFRFALSRIKKVIRIASAALKRLYFWLSGKPFGTVDSDSLEFMTTRWSPDFDTINFMSKGCSESVTALHMNRITFMNASFQFMISVSLEVMGILVKVATQNWFLAAHAVYKALIRLKEWNSEQCPYYTYLITGAF
jgi:hypothetical protein